MRQGLMNRLFEAHLQNQNHHFFWKLTRTFLQKKKKKKPVDFDGELKIGNVRYNNLTYVINSKVQLFGRLQYEM